MAGFSASAQSKGIYIEVKISKNKSSMRVIPALFVPRNDQREYNTSDVESMF